MKHIIEFNLPDDQEDLDTTMNASKYYSALWDMYQHLRQITKHFDEDEFKDKAIAEAIYKDREEIYSQFWMFVGNHDINDM